MKEESNIKTLMTIEYQNEILRFLCQSKNSKKYVEALDQKCFDLPDKQLVFGMLSDYIKEYKSTPNETKFIEYFETLNKKQKIPQDVKEALIVSIKDCYKYQGEESLQYKKSIVKYAQRKKTKNLITENSDKIKNGGDDLFEFLQGEITKIVRLSELEKDEQENNSGGYLFADHNKDVFKDEKIYETYITQLNRMTGAGGFYSPQLIIFLGGPKSFKTGLLINLAVDFAQNGVKVYYVDTENGIKSIRNRANQRMLECNRKELVEGTYQKELKQIISRSQIMGGELRIDYYPANQKSCADIDARLQQLKEDDNFIPEIIIIDYPDLLVPEDKSVKDKRLKIQEVYHDIIRLNNKRNTLSFGVSQVSKQAVEKEIITLKDFAEDFGKAMNCHAAFALCRTPEEKENGLGRLCVVVQREGVDASAKQMAVLEIDESTMQIVTSNFSKAKNKMDRRFRTQNLNDD